MQSSGEELRVTQRLGRTRLCHVGSGVRLPGGSVSGRGRCMLPGAVARARRGINAAEPCERPDRGGLDPSAGSRHPPPQAPSRHQVELDELESAMGTPGD